MLLSEAIGYETNIPVPGIGYYPMSWVVIRKDPDTSQTTQTTSIALDYPLELVHKTLLLKTPCTFVSGPRDMA